MLQQNKHQKRSNLFQGKGPNFKSFEPQILRSNKQKISQNNGFVGQNSVQDDLDTNSHFQFGNKKLRKGLNNVIQRMQKQQSKQLKENVVPNFFMTHSMQTSIKPTQKELLTTSKNITESPQESKLTKESGQKNDLTVPNAPVSSNTTAQKQQNLNNCGTVNIKKHNNQSKAEVAQKLSGDVKQEYVGQEPEPIGNNSYINNLPDGSSHFMQTSYTKSVEDHNLLAVCNHSIPNEISEYEEEEEPRNDGQTQRAALLQHLGVIIPDTFGISGTLDGDIGVTGGGQVSSLQAALEGDKHQACGQVQQHFVHAPNTPSIVSQQESHRRHRASQDLMVQTNGMQTVMSSVMNEFYKMSDGNGGCLPDVDCCYEELNLLPDPMTTRYPEDPYPYTCEDPNLAQERYNEACSNPYKPMKNLCSSPAEPKTTNEMLTTVPQGAASPSQQAMAIQRIRETVGGCHKEKVAATIGRDNNYDSTNTIKYGSFYYNSSPSSPSQPNLPTQVKRTQPTIDHFYDEGIIEIENNTGQNCLSIHNKQPSKNILNAEIQISRRRPTTTSQTQLQSNNQRGSFPSNPSPDPFSPPSSYQHPAQPPSSNQEAPHTNNAADLPSYSNLISFGCGPVTNGTVTTQGGGATGGPATGDAGSSAVTGERRSSLVVRQVSLQPSMNASSQRKGKESGTAESEIELFGGGFSIPVDQQLEAAAEILQNHRQRTRKNIRMNQMGPKNNQYVSNELQATLTERMASGLSSGQGQIESGDQYQNLTLPQGEKESFKKLCNSVINNQESKLYQAGNIFSYAPQSHEDNSSGIPLADPYSSHQIHDLKSHIEQSTQFGGKGNMSMVCTTVKKNGATNESENAYHKVNARDHLDNSSVTFQYYNSSKFASNSTTQMDQQTAPGQVVNQLAALGGPNCFYLSKSTTKSDANNGFSSLNQQDFHLQAPNLNDSNMPMDQYNGPLSINHFSKSSSNNQVRTTTHKKSNLSTPNSPSDPSDKLLICQEIIMIEDGDGREADEECENSIEEGWRAAPLLGEGFFGLGQRQQVTDQYMGPLNMQQDDQCEFEQGVAEGCEVIQERSSIDEQSKSITVKSIHESSTSNASSVVRVSINPSVEQKCNRVTNINQSTNRSKISSGGNNIECDHDMINFLDGRHPYSDLQAPQTFITSAQMPKEQISSSSTSQEDCWVQKATTSLDELVLRKRMKTSEKLISDNRLQIISKKDKINLHLAGQQETHGRNTTSGLEQRPSSVLGPQSSKFVVNGNRQHEQQRAYCSLGSSPHKTPDSQDQSYTILQMASSAHKLGVSCSTLVPKQSNKSNGCEGSDGQLVPQIQTQQATNPDNNGGCGAESQFLKPHAFSLSQGHSTEEDKPHNMQCDDEFERGDHDFNQLQYLTGRNEQRPDDDQPDIQVNLNSQMVEPTQQIIDGLRNISGVDTALLNSLFQNLNQLNALCSTQENNQNQNQSSQKQQLTHNQIPQSNQVKSQVHNGQNTNDLNQISDQNLQNRINNFTKQIKEISAKCELSQRIDQSQFQDHQNILNETKQIQEKTHDPAPENFSLQNPPSNHSKDLQEFISQEHDLLQQHLMATNHIPLAPHPRSRQPPLLPNIVISKHSMTLEDQSAGVRWGFGSGQAALCQSQNWQRIRNLTEKSIKTSEEVAGAATDTDNEDNFRIRDFVNANNDIKDNENQDVNNAGLGQDKNITQHNQQSKNMRRCERLNSWSKASGGASTKGPAANNNCGSSSSRWQRQFRSSRSRSAVKSSKARSQKSSGNNNNCAQPSQLGDQKDELEVRVDHSGQRKVDGLEIANQSNCTEAIFKDKAIRDHETLGPAPCLINDQIELVVSNTTNKLPSQQPEPRQKQVIVDLTLNVIANQVNISQKQFGQKKIDKRNLKTNRENFMNVSNSKILQEKPQQQYLFGQNSQRSLIKNKRGSQALLHPNCKPPAPLSDSIDFSIPKVKRPSTSQNLKNAGTLKQSHLEKSLQNNLDKKPIQVQITQMQPQINRKSIQKQPLFLNNSQQTISPITKQPASQRKTASQCKPSLIQNAEALKSQTSTSLQGKYQQPQPVTAQMPSSNQQSISQKGPKGSQNFQRRRSQIVHKSSKNQLKIQTNQQIEADKKKGN